MPQYEWNASSYHAHSHAQAAWADETIARLDLSPDDRVLDVGCGDGKITMRLAELACEGCVIGVDSSASMVDYAKSRFAGAAPRVTFQRVDAAALEFYEEFDAVFSNAALHWIRDHQPVLRGIQRALAPGGRVCMQMGGRGNAAEVKAIVDEIRDRPEWERYFDRFEYPYSFYGPEQYERWLEAAGLVLRHLELVSRPMRHTPQQFGGWLSTTWMPYTNRVPEDDRSAFVDQIVELYAQRHPMDDRGILTIPMVRLNVDAGKA